MQYPDVGRLLHGYFVDFVVSGDPSARKREGVPRWPKYVDQYEEEGMPGLELRMESFENTRVEGDGERRVQCEWWREAGRQGRLEK